MILDHAPSIRATRRATLTGMLAGLAASIQARSSPAADVPPSRVFDIFRKGDPVGHHAMTFSPDPAGGFVVDHDIEIVIKVAFITAYSYRQQGRDTWRGGMMVGSVLDTDDDGTRTRVQIVKGGDKLQVDGPAGTYAVPMGTMNDISMWNAGIMRLDHVVDGQNGQYTPIQPQPAVAERVAVGGQMVETERYTVLSTKGREGRIWYAKASMEWVKGLVVTRGETLDYQLRT